MPVATMDLCTGNRSNRQRFLLVQVTLLCDSLRLLDRRDLDIAKSHHAVITLEHKRAFGTLLTG